MHNIIFRTDTYNNYKCKGLCSFSKKIIIVLIAFLGVTFQGKVVGQNLPDTLQTIQVDTIDIVDDSDTIYLNAYDLADSLIVFAEKYLGIHYKYGGITSSGFDCSGFTYFVFDNFGISLPHSSRDQALKGQSLQKDEICKGDLLFFKGRNKSSSRIGHVGLAVENCDTAIRFIHASSHKGITYDYTTSTYYAQRYLGAKRIIGVNINDTIWGGLFSDTPIAEDSIPSDTISEDAITSENIIQIVTSQKEEGITHTVLKGDNLFAIARKYGTSVENIKDINDLDSDRIYPGQKLKISDPK